jgi:t-SNARE complex subunit (syntaxin)
MSQLNDYSQEQAKMVMKQGEVINSIESQTLETKDNIVSAVSDMREANDANKATGGWLNKLVYIVIAVVGLLIILSWIMPK